MLKVLLTHDVDRLDKTFQYFSRINISLKQLSASGWRSWIVNMFKKDPYFMIDEIIRLEEKHGVRSTFFFLNESLAFNPFMVSNWPLSLGYYKFNDPRLKKIYPRLLSGGWEIGLHGSYLSYNDYNLLVKEKKLLEDAIGSSVFGIRQHFLNLTQNTWILQARAGFKYDSSWGHTRAIGFKDNIYKEFNPLENNDFKVVPLALMDFCVMAVENYLPKIIEIIENCINNNGVLVINWHQRTFNDFEFPGYRTVYEEIINLCKSYNASFYTIKDYLERNKMDTPGFQIKF
jgi:peptidoglycan/xylan/chitin deacetylase (PgdA/CDA1 family)